MGFDRGFDISPRLEPTPANKTLYAKFIEEILTKYDNVIDKDSRRQDKKLLEYGTNVVYKSNKDYISFTVGEYPGMPANPEHCEYFLRFSSKISGSYGPPADKYITEVYKIARKWFGNRVKPWHDYSEGIDPSYDWQEVHDAAKTLRELVEAEELQKDGKSEGDKEGEGGDGKGVVSEAST
jgi:hypothetical protein